MGPRDILIIGGGIFGASIAYHLACRGLGERVLLLEQNQIAGGATSYAAALVTQVRDDPAQIRLSQETFRVMQTLEKRFGQNIGRRRLGALHIAPNDHAQMLRTRAEHCQQFGIGYRWLKETAAIEVSEHLAPWLSAEAFNCGVFYPEECYVDPYLFCNAYLHVAKAFGVATRRNTKVRSIREVAGKIRGVELADGSRLSARIVINATGAWANLLSVPVGLPLPMAPVRSQYWITEHAHIFPQDGAIVLMPTIRAYARPEGGGLLFGIREKKSVVVDPRHLPADLSGFAFDPQDPEGWESLSENAEALTSYLPSLKKLGIAHYITGPSNYSIDGQLLLGTHPDISGLLVACGCNGGRLRKRKIKHVKPIADSRY